MSAGKDLSETLSFLSPGLLTEIQEGSQVTNIPKNTEILKFGQYIKVIPIVLHGLIKVFTRHDEKELLLYYIKHSESCIMSFAGSLKNEPSQVFAITEEDTTVLLMPTEKVAKWTVRYPDINLLFFQQYSQRYSELLDTINHLLFDKLDKRLYKYLQERTRLTGKNLLKIPHRQIANELGTAREVITRVMKKLEAEGKIKQHNNCIEILPW